MKYVHFLEQYHAHYIDDENNVYVRPGELHSNMDPFGNQFFYLPDGTAFDSTDAIFVKEDCHSDVFLRQYLKFCNTKKNFCSHVLLMEHKTKLQSFILTDAAMNIEPSLTDFVEIIKNATRFHNLLRTAEGYDESTTLVNFLNYSGAFSLKNKEALTANHLKTYFDIHHSGEYYFTNWQLDSCLYAESRKAKHLSVEGDIAPHIIVAPNISVGNAIYKCLMKDYNCYGFVVGGDNYAVLNSRSDLDKNDYAIRIIEKIRELDD